MTETENRVILLDLPKNTAMKQKRPVARCNIPTVNSMLKIWEKNWVTKRYAYSELCCLYWKSVYVDSFEKYCAISAIWQNLCLMISRSTYVFDFGCSECSCSNIAPQLKFMAVILNAEADRGCHFFFLTMASFVRGNYTSRHLICSEFSGLLAAAA